MATCDLLEFYGSSPANFLDVGGGADETKIEKSLEMLSKQQVKGIFVNFFAGITRCDDVANGIINASKKFEINVPMVIRLVGTNDDEGIQILEDNGINAFGKMEPAAGRRSQNCLFKDLNLFCLQGFILKSPYTPSGPQKIYHFHPSSPPKVILFHGLII